MNATQKYFFLITEKQVGHFASFPYNAVPMPLMERVFPGETSVVSAVHPAEAGVDRVFKTDVITIVIVPVEDSLEENPRSAVSAFLGFGHMISFRRGKHEFPRPFCRANRA